MMRGDNGPVGNARRTVCRVWLGKMQRCHYSSDDACLLANLQVSQISTGVTLSREGK